MRKSATLLLAGLLAVAAASGSTDTLRLDARQAVDMALSSPKQVEWATAKMMEAVAGTKAAFGAFLPQVSATGTYTRLAKASEFTMMAAHESVFGVPVFDPNSPLPSDPLSTEMIESKAGSYAMARSRLPRSCAPVTVTGTVTVLPEAAVMLPILITSGAAPAIGMRQIRSSAIMIGIPCFIQSP